MSEALQTYGAGDRERGYFFLQLGIQVGSFCVGYLLAKSSKEQLALLYPEEKDGDSEDVAVSSELALLWLTLSMHLIGHKSLRVD